MADEEPKPPKPKFRRSGLKLGPTTLEQYPEHAKLLGLIVAEWASFDTSLIFLVSQAVKVSPFVLLPIMISVNSSRAKFEALRIVLPLAKLPEDVQGEIDDILDKAERLGELRNKYAHAQYGISSKSGLSILRLKYFGSGQKELDLPVKLDEMQSLFDRMKDLSARVAEVTSALTFPGFREQIFADQDRAKES